MSDQLSSVRNSAQAGAPDVNEGAGEQKRRDYRAKLESSVKIREESDQNPAINDILFGIAVIGGFGHQAAIIGAAQKAIIEKAASAAGNQVGDPEMELFHTALPENLEELKKIGLRYGLLIVVHIIGKEGDWLDGTLGKTIQNSWDTLMSGGGNGKVLAGLRQCQSLAEWKFTFGGPFESRLHEALMTTINKAPENVRHNIPMRVLNCQPLFTSQIVEEVQTLSNFRREKSGGTAVTCELVWTDALDISSSHYVRSTRDMIAAAKFGDSFVISAPRPTFRPQTRGDGPPQRLTLTVDSGEHKKTQINVLKTYSRGNLGIYAPLQHSRSLKNIPPDSEFLQFTPSGDNKFNKAKAAIQLGMDLASRAKGKKVFLIIPCVNSETTDMDLFNNIADVYPVKTLPENLYLFPLPQGKNVGNESILGSPNARLRADLPSDQSFQDTPVNASQAFAINYQGMPVAIHPRIRAFEKETTQAFLEDMGFKHELVTWDIFGEDKNEAALRAAFHMVKRKYTDQNKSPAQVFVEVSVKESDEGNFTKIKEIGTKVLGPNKSLLLQKSPQGKPIFVLPRPPGTQVLTVMLGSKAQLDASVVAAGKAVEKLEGDLSNQQDKHEQPQYVFVYCGGNKELQEQIDALNTEGVNCKNIFVFPLGNQSGLQMAMSNAALNTAIDRAGGLSKEEKSFTLPNDAALRVMVSPPGKGPPWESANETSLEYEIQERVGFNRQPRVKPFEAATVDTDLTIDNLAAPSDVPPRTFEDVDWLLYAQTYPEL